ncbi:MAG: energy transducer TonB [Prevotellaceae bacterium]|jgi:TonB family protein|nr:energy transducer TonB [Prevotellaceae bacterium]
MAKKIKFSFLKMLFRLFSFLADKTNGWKVFVKPKILLGTLLLGSVVVSCNQKGEGETTCYVPSGIDTISECYKPVLDDTITPPAENTLTPNIDCYMIVSSPIIEDTEDTSQIYYFVEQMPYFIGGETALFNFLTNNLRYPLAAQEAGVQGRVTVRFVVTKTGEIDKNRIEIVKGLHPACDREVIRLIHSMPKWQAGKQNGVSAAVWYTLPITFRLVDVE